MMNPNIVRNQDFIFSRNDNVTLTNLSLTINTTYYFSIRAENSAGLLGVQKSSDGITIVKKALNAPTGFEIKE